MTLGALLTSPTVVALAGGGSGGFGGGGGGGGGGGFGGGGSGGGSDSPVVVVLSLAFFALIVLVYLHGLWRRARRTGRGIATRRRRDARDRSVRAELAAAAEDDPAFDPDAIVAAARRLVGDVQDAWDARDVDRLRTLVAGDLLTEWLRRLEDFERRGWHSRSLLVGTPHIRLVGAVNRAGVDDDGVVVHVRGSAESWVDTPEGPVYETGRGGTDVRLAQYWTLVRRGDAWALGSIEEDEEGRHHLDAAVVATPDRDPALADDARTDLAVAAAAGSPDDVATLVSSEYDDDARAAALDLSLVDDRFSPAVIDADVRRTLRAWSTAVDGPDADLERRADAAAVRSLLWSGPGDGERIVVRGLEIDRVRIARVDGEASPPRVELEVDYRGRRYREDRDTQSVVEGSRSAVVRRRGRWTLALADGSDPVWRLVRARDQPAPRG